MKVTSELVKKRVLDSPVVFENIDWRWALVYCALSLGPLDIVDQKRQQPVPKRLARSGSKSKIKTFSTVQTKERWKYPTPPEKLNAIQKKKGFCSYIR